MHCFDRRYIIQTVYCSICNCLYMYIIFINFLLMFVFVNSQDEEENIHTIDSNNRF